MTPQVDFDAHDQVASATPPTAPVASERFERTAVRTPHEGLTAGERQGLAMGWVVIALTTFLLLGGLALWAAAVFNAGFGAWLLAMAVMGVITVATVIAANYFVMRARR